MSADGSVKPCDLSDGGVVGPLVIGSNIAASAPLSIAMFVEAPTAASRATPFYFMSQGQPLFAWLHARGSEAGYDHGVDDHGVDDHGVVICPPIGHEQLHAHRGLRHLAEALAERGIPVLRFDWYATGDSAGGDEDADLCAHWLANVCDAVQLMKDRLGLQRVSVVGLRSGGLLAVEGLAGETIDNLVLWAPVSNGRRFVRELQLIESTARDAGRKQKNIGENRGVEAAGFGYSAETIAGLSALNMVKRQIKCRRALVAFRDDVPGDAAVSDWLASCGVATESRKLPGMKQMLAEPHDTQVPWQAIADISNWLAEPIAGISAVKCEINPECLGKSSARMVYSERSSDANRGPAVLCDSEHRDSAICHEPVAFHERLWQLSQPLDAPHRLFGVLSEPEQPASRLPLIVLLNSGAAYRIGASRLNVLLARRLAVLGFRCLRFDLRGLGDSPVDSVERENDSYPATAFADVAAVLAAARRDFGHDRCVVAGLCSGAYTAFQAAAQLDDPALVESIVINPLTFYWRDGMKLDDPEVLVTLDRYWQMSRGFDFQRLWKFVSGRSDVGYAGAARALAAQLRDCFARKAAPQSVRSRRTDTDTIGCAGPCGHPITEDLPRDLVRVARAGRRLTMFLAEGDPGLTILNCQARRQTRQLRRQGILSVTRIPNADHIFSRRAPRNALIDRIAAQLSERYLL